MVEKEFAEYLRAHPNDGTKKFMSLFLQLVSSGTITRVDTGTALYEIHADLLETME